MRDCWQKFYMAVETLLTNSASLQKRLAIVYLDHIKEINENDLSPDIRQNFIELMAGFIMVEASFDEERIEAGLTKMPYLQASYLADKIIRIFGMIAEDEALGIEQRDSNYFISKTLRSEYTMRLSNNC